MAKSKYNAVKVREDGFVFDSKKEHMRYCELKMMRMANEIQGLIVHPQFPIELNGKRICIVELDFYYLDSRDVGHYEDVKGFDTALSKLKRKLVEANHGMKVEVL